MSVVLKNNDFVKIVDLLKDLKEDCVFTFTKKSIKINTIDDAQINFIKISLEDVYSQCKLKREVSINVNLKSLHKILQCMEKDEICEIKFKEDFIQLIFKNLKNNGHSKYKLKLLVNEDDEEELDDIEVEQNATLQMSSKYFTSLCKKIGKFDESILIECNEEENEVLVKSGTEDSVELKVVLEEGKLNKLIIEEDLRIMLLLKYLIIFTKGEKFTDQVTINITDENSPLEIIYIFENSYIKFYSSSQDIDD